MPVINLRPMTGVEWHGCTADVLIEAQRCVPICIKHPEFGGRVMMKMVREANTAEIVERTGIDEDLIERVVRAFYERVRTDDFIGPVFAERITDWEPHLQRMCAFWSSVALLTGRYHGQPMPRHMPLPIDARHFDRWISLFVETVRELCSPTAADYFIERARRIAESLEMGIANGHGVLLNKGQRFLRE